LYLYSNGLKTNRDALCYNFSKSNLRENIKRSIDYYSDQVTQYLSAKTADEYLKAIDFINLDPHFFSWSRKQKKDIERGKKNVFNENDLILSLYRPFQKQFCYFNLSLNEVVGQLPKLFPTPNHQNVVICVSSFKNNLPFITGCIPDFYLNGDSQCFPHYYYEVITNESGNLFSLTSEAKNYTRHDGITDFIHKEYQKNME
jgi:predicted helicase